MTRACSPSIHRAAYPPLLATLALLLSPVVHAQQSEMATVAGQEARVTDAATVLGSLAGYAGRWSSDRKTAPDGRTYRFGYELGWFDEARTIAEVRITQRWSEGRVDLLWHGYKGQASDGSGVYYWAASPSGRGARGTVHLEGDRLVTLYEGWGPEGSPVHLRDVFTPVDAEGWISRTYLREPGDPDWRRIAVDHWERAG